MLAAIRADLHNTAGKSFGRTFASADFMPGATTASIEDRIYALIEQGYPPAAAAAMATSTQSRDDKRMVIQTTLDNANRLKKKRVQRAG